MWCQHCQQEAPALGSASPDGPKCARCNQTLGRQAEPDHKDATRTATQALRAARATAAGGGAARTFRFDLAQTGLTEPAHSQQEAGRSTSNSPAAPRRSGFGRTLQGTSTRPPSRGTQVIAWTLCTIGTALLGMGIGLIAWSVLDGQYRLWVPGLATAIGGQGLVIVGLLQLLANLWAAGRVATQRLAQVHDELRALRRVTDESAGRQHGSAAQFYSGLAQDATPEMLLGNLRGQIDALSSRLRAE